MQRLHQPDHEVVTRHLVLPFDRAALPVDPNRPRTRGVQDDFKRAHNSVFSRKDAEHANNTRKNLGELRAFA
jgi:hypothetical protein